MANPRRVAPTTIGPKGVERPMWVFCAGILRVAAPTGLLPWLAVQSVCPFDPLGAVHIYVWLSVRGFAMLTRGYRVVRPPWGRRPRRHPRNMPWWYRCPRAYVGAAHSAKLPAPQGSHYSIAAGERSEPAEGGPHHHRPQGGRTPYVGVLRRHPSGGSSPSACLPSFGACGFSPVGILRHSVGFFRRRWIVYLCFLTIFYLFALPLPK